jgi:hypothetical protein
VQVCHITIPVNIKSCVLRPCQDLHGPYTRTTANIQNVLLVAG